MSAQNGNNQHSISIYNYNYDQKGDVLYLFLGNEPRPSYSVPLDNNRIYLRKDIFTNDLSGITILDFMKMYKIGELNNLQLPLKIDLKKIATSLIY